MHLALIFALYALIGCKYALFAGNSEPVLAVSERRSDHIGSFLIFGALWPVWLACEGVRWMGRRERDGFSARLRPPTLVSEGGRAERITRDIQ